MQPEANKPSRLKIRVTNVAETVIRGGHPWIYADSIREINREGQLGELAVVYDRKDRFLAVGLYDPDSPLRVRVVHQGKPQTLDSAWWQARLQQTIQRRAGLFDEDTNGYRIISGENDGWPGLVLDRYAGTLVLKLYTAAWLVRLPEIIGWLQTGFSSENPVGLPGPRITQLVLRLSRNIQELAQAQFKLRDSQRLDWPTSAANAEQTEAPVVFQETGINFEAAVFRGQKTGFFLDQRENRRKVETLAQGREVLNAFSFSGGFSLYAARGQARMVADLDISPVALESAKRNFALNQGNPLIARCPHETIQADAFDWLADTGGRKFDLIVLDPPSLAKREAERVRAIEAYARLAATGLVRLRAKGILVSASCSAHVTREEFFQVVRQTVQRSGRQHRELEITTHPPDHPATYPEAHYLKCVYFEVS